MSYVDISFLKQVVPENINLSIAGREYLEWQDNNNFFTDLVSILDNCYNEKLEELELTKEYRTAIENVIAKHSNINVSISNEVHGNLAIDAGFISPGNILNTDGIEDYYKKSASKIGEVFRHLKGNIIKGWCDPKTGKVEGYFKNIPFTIYINTELKHWMDLKYLKNNNAKLSEVIASFILHECGHAFFGLMAISRSMIDNTMMAMALRMYTNEPEPSKKVAIIKDTLKSLECKVPKDEDLKNLNNNEVTVIFSKCIKNRDYQRSLSMGVTNMTCEVLADAYAIKMGAGKALVSGIGSFNAKNKNRTFWSLVMFVVLDAFFMLAGLPFFGFLMALFFYINLYMFISNSLVSWIYDTDYRRSKNVLRDTIIKISNDKNISKSMKDKLLADAKVMEAQSESIKPFFEGTALQRFMGYLENGSDFRKNDFEHYTAELTGTSLELYTNYFTK